MTDYKNIKYNLPIKWQSSIKTGNFTAESGEGYFINTTSGAVTITLPASPSVGDFVGILDYARTFGSNKCLIDPNGSNIEGGTADNALKTSGGSATLFYADATKGWSYIQQSDVGDLEAPGFVAATGGTITTCGNYKIHTFNSSGTFTVTDAGNPLGSNTVDYMVIGGGGSGGVDNLTILSGRAGGGGGAGGFRESVPNPAAWTASPLANPGGALPVSVQGYPITVGAGGGSRSVGQPPTSATGNPGSSSIFSTITSAGGGAGGGHPTSAPFCAGQAATGGSGGGATSDRCGASGNTPPTSPPQGNPGGNGSFEPSGPHAGGGGGGAGAAGAAGTGPTGNGPGGNGVATNISGSSVTRAGGGGAVANNWNPASPGGSGGGGAGGVCGVAGTVNTGSGGGGGGCGACQTGASGAGGSGVVIIRYKFQ